jgi:hypothetical protein
MCIVMNAAMQALFMGPGGMAMLGVVGQLASWRLDPRKPPIRACTSHIPDGWPFQSFEGREGSLDDGKLDGPPQRGPVGFAGSELGQPCDARIEYGYNAETAPVCDAERLDDVVDGAAQALDCGAG